MLNNDNKSHKIRRSRYSKLDNINKKRLTSNNKNKKRFNSG